jgi:hypothetical protein
MNSQLIQNAADSIMAIAKPDMKTIWFAIAMIDLVLMSQTRDIDWQNSYRQSLVWIREVLELYRETLDEVQNND